MTQDKQQQFKARKRAWENLITPRVDWETFKRIAGGSTSLEAAVKQADMIRVKRLKKQS